MDRVQQQQQQQQRRHQQSRHPRHSLSFTRQLVTLLALLACLLSALRDAPTRVTSYTVDYAVYHNVERVFSSLELWRQDPRISDVFARIRTYRERTPVHQLPLYHVYLTDFAHEAIVRESPRPSPPPSSTETTPVTPATPATSTSTKLRVLFTFGEHPRELISVESALDLIRFLLHGVTQLSCSDPDGYTARFILRHVHVHIAPLVNPDGKQVMEERGDMCMRHNGRGIDLNRNADWQFGGPASSDQPNNEEYRGEAPFSEVETRFVRWFTRKYDLDAYFSIHSGEQQFFTAFVDSESKRTQRRHRRTAMHAKREQALGRRVRANETAEQWAARETRVGDAIMARTSGWFRNWGTAWEMNSYAADGALFDWMAGSANVPYSFCAEVWGGPMLEDCFDQFNPEPSRLQTDLDRIRPFYIESLLALIEIELGVPFARLSVDLVKQHPKLAQAVIDACQLEDDLVHIVRALPNRFAAHEHHVAETFV